MSEYEQLRAGALSIVFDPSGGQLRWLRYGATEVLRGIYGAVRDKNWATISPRIEELTIDRRDDSFRIEFVALCQRGEIDYRWRGEIAGTADAVVRYRFSGESHSMFLRNRIGLCVLHPIRECAGQPCQVLHPDGTAEDAVFPRLIAPQQPFLRVAGLRNRVNDDIEAEVRFYGDVFETEDQRNWTDASFKTYSTPLNVPFPVEVKPGDAVEQDVVVKLVGRARRLTSSRPEMLPMAVGSGITLPRIGFLHLARIMPLSNGELGLLAQLRPDHIRIELRAGDPSAADDLDAAMTDGRRLGAGLQIVLDHNGGSAIEIPRMLDALRAHADQVVEWIVLERGNVAQERALRQVRAGLSEWNNCSRVGTGTNGNFAELNRNRPAAAVADLFSYAVNPQAHAFDNATIAENIAGQGETVRAAREFARNTDVHVGPITLRGRLPAAVVATACGGMLTKISPDADPRQLSPFLAAWTLGSIAALSREGAASATYFELVGCRGIIGSRLQAQLPEPFGSVAAGVYPVYHVFADLAEMSGGTWHALNAEIPDAAAGLLCRQARSQIALVANLSERPCRCKLPFAPSRLRVLDRTTTMQAMHAPAEFRAVWREWSTCELELPPHSYARSEGAVQ
jgi:hypothetical protein